MAGLRDRLRRRAARPDPRDEELAGRLEPRRAAAAEAERALADAVAQGAPPQQVRAARAAVDARLTAALEAADARYRLVLGPDAGELKRVRLLARLARPEVKEADRLRREIALARTHHRVAARDDPWSSPIAAVPPSVGTAPTTLGTASGH